MSTQINYRQRLSELLQAHPALAALTEAETFELASLAQIGYGEVGLTVLSAGAAADTFFMVLSGQLRAQTANHCQGYYRVGDMVGVRAWLDQQPQTQQIEVAVAAHVAVFSEAAWQWLQTKYPETLTQLSRLETLRLASLTVPGQSPDEGVLTMTHAHPFPFLLQLKWVLAWLSIPLLRWALADVLVKTMFAPLVTQTWLVMLTTAPFIMMALLTLAYYYWQWRQYYFILTTQRVIKQQWQLLGGTTRQIVPLTYVQAITLHQESWLGHLMDYQQVDLVTVGGGLLQWADLPRAAALKNQLEEELPLAHERLQTIIKQTTQQVEQVQHVIQMQGIASSPLPLPSRWPTWLHYIWPQLYEILPYTTADSTVKWRTHYGVWLKQVAKPCLSGLILLALGGSVWGGWLSTPYNTPLQLCLGLGVLMSLGWYGGSHEAWRRRVYVATPHGVRGQAGEFSFDQIEEITYQLPPDYRGWLNIGTVQIKLYGDLPLVEWSQVFNPVVIQQELFHRLMRYQQRQKLAELPTVERKIIDISPHLAKKNRPQPTDMRQAA